MNNSKFGERSTTTSLAVMSVFALLFSSAVSADLFAEADRAAQEGRLSDMQSLYERILEVEPANVRALTGKAAAQAWQGKYRAAQATYRSALELAPDDLNARVGLGYAYAWAGEYSKAHTAFNTALHKDPFNIGARKGIGYAYLWAGEHEFALDAFGLAESIAPQDAEIAEASGHASMKLGRARDAIESYDRTLAYDPHRESAARARLDAYTTAPALEVSAQYGSTSNVDSGLRAAELASWPTMSTRLALRYDDSLSLDNRSLAQRGEEAPGYYFGVQQSFGTRWLGAVELGQRQLVDGDQNLVAISGVVHTAPGALKIGAQLGRHDAGYNDELLYGGFSFPVAERWQIEPVLFLSQFGPSDDSEWRAVVNAMFHSSHRWNAGVQIGRGDIDASDPAFSGQTTLLGAWTNVHVADQLTLNLSLRQEKTPTETLDMALLGLTYRTPRN